MYLKISHHCKLDINYFILHTHLLIGKSLCYSLLQLLIFFRIGLILKMTKINMTFA